MVRLGSKLRLNPPGPLRLLSPGADIIAQTEAQRQAVERAHAKYERIRREETERCYAAAEWAAFKRWDASKGNDTNYNEHGWPTT